MQIHFTGFKGAQGLKRNSPGFLAKSLTLKSSLESQTALSDVIKDNRYFVCFNRRNWRRLFLTAKIKNTSTSI